MDKIENELRDLMGSESNCTKIRYLIANFCKDFETNKEYFEMIKLLDSIKPSEYEIDSLLDSPFKDRSRIKKILKAGKISNYDIERLKKPFKYVGYIDGLSQISLIGSDIVDDIPVTVRLFKNRVELITHKDKYPHALWLDKNNVEVDIKEGTYIKSLKGHDGNNHIKIILSVTNIHTEPEYDIEIKTKNYKSGWTSVGHLDTENIQDFMDLYDIEF
jgi:hypothetical protein